MFGDQNSSHSAGDAAQISCRRHDKITIFDLSGDIDFANSRQLRESVLREIDENRTSHAMVNLSAVRYIVSSGIVSLVEV
jgi:anti-anti-sigma factor